MSCPSSKRRELAGAVRETAGPSTYFHLELGDVLGSPLVGLRKLTAPAFTHRLHSPIIVRERVADALFEARFTGIHPIQVAVRRAMSVGFQVAEPSPVYELASPDTLGRYVWACNASWSAYIVEVRCSGIRSDGDSTRVAPDGIDVFNVDCIPNL